jgi:glycyl-tRNA synthetase beta chain
MAEYFFELLTEEIPASMHDAAHAAIAERVGAIVTGLGGDSHNACVTSTPRRLIFMIANLPLREPDREQEVKGPPKKSGPQALQGFLRKNGATEADILDSGDEYVRIRKQIAGRETRAILQEEVPRILESLRWPKTMRWGSGEHAYIRPIHSMVSVFDGEHLPITIFGVASGMSTEGHRTLAPKSFVVSSYNDYVTRLELARVVADHTRRRHVMAERARVLAQQVGGEPSLDATIWSQWQFLTEYPGVVRAEFRSEFLSLPEEVLVTVMRVHQKQLPIRDESGRLTSSFLAVLDNDGDPDGHAAYGNGFVTNARFADAKFFYETDRRRRLEERIEQLAHLQFHEKLGNYRDKTERITAIVREIGGSEEALTAARLAKTDLVTEMVKEFTDLQGKIGGIYAREEGYPEEVWQAVYDHYLPQNAEDPLPRTLSGALVSLADKIDTLAGFFLIDAKPTGSKDPFGLRRAAQGVVQILLNRDMREIRVGVDRLLEVAFAQHAADASAAGTETARRDLYEFLAERVRTLLEVSRYGFAYDEIAAAMESGWSSSLPDLVDRVTALKSVRDEANFLSILDSAKRIANITAGHDSTRVDSTLFEHDVERRLNQLVDAVGEQIEEMVAERQYVRALESFAALAPELETFFRDVMVMVEDEAVRKNRMSLLRKAGNAVKKVADVTRIVVDRRDYRA